MPIQNSARLREREIVMIKETYATFDEFWLDFLRAHSKPGTRAFHYAGMLAALWLGVMFAMSGQGYLLVLAILAPYVLGFASHALVEHNKPVSLKHPVYSVRGAVQMFVLWAIGRLGPELAKAGV
ncbi:MAG TPA: DUF962 domain-containing protein [Hyphomicrobium sp.]|nr:DUF962 domain-containing protein [Hyphomicrobium sp.]